MYPFLLSACDPSIDDYESYKNLKVGEHFSVNVMDMQSK